jgi:hypothetical protein
MPEPIDFEQIAKRIPFGDSLPAGRLAPVVPVIAEQFRRTAPDVAGRLSQWTHHRPDCARRTDAAACDCGLDAELKKYVPDAEPIASASARSGHRWP